MITLVGPLKEWWETEIKTNNYNNIHPELPIADFWQKK